MESCCFKITILGEICIKIRRYFTEKLQKSPIAKGFAPRPPRLRRLESMSSHRLQIPANPHRIEKSWSRHFYELWPLNIIVYTKNVAPLPPVIKMLPRTRKTNNENFSDF